MWAPYMNKIKSILGENAVVFRDSAIFTGYKNLVGNKQFIQDNKDVTLKLLRAYIDTELFIKANKAESIKIVARELHIDKKSVEYDWSGYDFHVSLTRDLLDAVIAEAYWVMLNRKNHKGQTLPNYSTYFAPEYLKQVYNVRVRW
ncbi:substrate-binding domain-containing protein [Niabella ginsengisoli]|uniref:Uncharacterized protein n=1 Tax=Niabella ginsengisoli TaxID=522298 RepID=A0ABS9SQS2_9BACT|nr:hypothetical protein [Niabella ginsengisoli]MCH5600712.1 hypothetical protein [Niabella ginsengisoli]